MSEAVNNFFLVIEGLDGSGKTEISRLLKQTLQQTVDYPRDVELTFEPHDPSAAGLFIRQVLTKRIKAKERTLALAFALNRADHNDRIINQFLDNGQRRILICDRYYLSSLVYQSTPSITMEKILAFNEGSRQPDLTIFLNAGTKTCYERMRKRPEDKELFERNLEATRQKYLDAIDFLKQRGETIVEVNADGDMESVLNAILDTLTAYGPKWLVIQRLLLQSSSEVFSLNGIHDAETKIEDIVHRFSERWEQGGILRGGGELRENLIRLKEDTENEVDWLSYDDLGLLFLGYLKRWGYTLLDRLPWTETCAYEMRYEMPLSVNQRGTALLLTETQRYDAVTKKIQILLDQAPDSSEINKLSDFMFVLDASASRQIEKYYETDAVAAKISPSVRIIHRRDIAGFIFIDTLAAYLDEYAYTIRAHPEMQQALTDTLEQFGLRQYWNLATQQKRN